MIVSRDAIRNARGEYWIPSQEDYVTDIEECGVNFAINRGLIPIIDATNLNPKTIEKWEKIAKERNCEIEYKKFYVPFKTALERDEKRDCPVGKKVLKRFYTQYFYDDFVKEVGYDNVIIRDPIIGVPACIIFDIDGTIAHHQGRLPLEWDKLDTDLCDSRIKHLLYRIMILGIKIIFLTGRPESVKKPTEEWLKKNIPDIEFSLIMRDSKDFRSGEIVKKELWEKYVEPHYNTLCVFEDSNKCVEMWRELGLLTCQVANGDY